jgi:hypothetical protein
MQLLGGDVGGLEADVGCAPRPRHDDGRAHGAQLARDRTRVQRPVRQPVRFALGAGAEHDGVVRGLAARDVHGVDLRMLAQEGADLAATGNEVQVVTRDQGREDLLEHRQQVIVDGVQFDDADGFVGE